MAFVDPKTFKGRGEDPVFRLAVHTSKNKKGRNPVIRLRGNPAAEALLGVPLGERIKLEIGINDDIGLILLRADPDGIQIRRRLDCGFGNLEGIFAKPIPGRDGASHRLVNGHQSSEPVELVRTVEGGVVLRVPDAWWVPPAPLQDPATVAMPAPEDEPEKQPEPAQKEAAVDGQPPFAETATEASPPASASSRPTPSAQPSPPPPPKAKTSPPSSVPPAKNPPRPAPNAASSATAEPLDREGKLQLLQKLRLQRADNASIKRRLRLTGDAELQGLSEELRRRNRAERKTVDVTPPPEPRRSVPPRISVRHVSEEGKIRQIAARFDKGSLYVRPGYVQDRKVND